MVTCDLCTLYLHVCNHKWTQSGGSSWSSCIRGVAAEVDTTGEQQMKQAKRAKLFAYSTIIFSGVEKNTGSLIHNFSNDANILVITFIFVQVVSVNVWWDTVSRRWSMLIILGLHVKSLSERDWWRSTQLRQVPSVLLHVIYAFHGIQTKLTWIIRLKRQYGSQIHKIQNSNAITLDIRY